MAELTITENIPRQRYEAYLGSELAGFSEYELSEGTITITHTVVEEDHEGQGVGSAIAKHVLDSVRAKGLKLVPQCQFIAGYIRKHPEYADLL